VNQNNQYFSVRKNLNLFLQTAVNKFTVTALGDAGVKTFVWPGGITAAVYMLALRIHIMSNDFLIPPTLSPHPGADQVASRS